MKSSKAVLWLSSLIAILFSLRGSLRGAFLLTGTLAYFLYNAASMAFGAAHDTLFLVYIVLFSASLFAFVLAITSFDLQVLLSRVSPHLPRRGMAVFLFVAGLVVSLVWLSDVVGALSQGPGATSADELYDGRHVCVRPGYDCAGCTTCRRIAAPSRCSGLPAGIHDARSELDGGNRGGSADSVGTARRVSLGVGQLVAFGGSFVVLSLIALWLTIVFLRHISDATTWESSTVQSTHP